MRSIVINLKTNIMKNKTTILISIFFTSFIIQCKSQTYTINMADTQPYLDNWDKSGQYYIKDVNNYLNNFVGTWEYVSGNEKFQIILEKIIKFHSVSLNPRFNYNYYTDGIQLKYKKFVNNTLIFQTPIQNPQTRPTFETMDGILLNGYIKDYGRLTKNVYIPLVNKLMYPGGAPVDANCEITKISTNQIKFHLYLRHEYPNYNTEAYAGQPLFSVPNDVIMTKVP